MRRRLQGLILLAAMAMAGCTTVKPKAPVIPKVVTVTVTKYVPVPDELTAPCHRTERKSNKVEDVVAAYNGRGDDLAECSGRMSKIRGLGH
jgi:hypothetical protein